MSYQDILEEHVSADVSMVSEWGQAVALMPLSGGSYNAGTGAITEPTMWTGLRGIFYNVRHSRVDGKEILATDKQVVLYWPDMPYGEAPKTDDILVDENDNKYTVKQRRELATANAWLLLVRPNGQV